ncbi:MAG TPA: type VI secretion system tube protein Hcp [Thermomicrobiaceae bacterium]|nr:type VI secretion system tube protein Hcp [Thermomicrobiaceae bacterium]
MAIEDESPAAGTVDGRVSGTSRRDLLRTATGVVAATVAGGALLEAGKSAVSPAPAAAAAATGDSAAIRGGNGFTFTIQASDGTFFDGDPDRPVNVIGGYGFDLDIKPSASSGNSGAGAGKITFTPVSLTKLVGPSTIQIFEALAAGDPLQVTLSFPGPATFKGTASGLTINLKLAEIVDQKLYVNPGDQTDWEQVQLQVGAVEMQRG